MKRIFLLIITCVFFFKCYANHIAAGELFYEYVGPGSTANTSKYKFTMRLFRDCNSSGQTLETESVIIGIYRTGNNSLYKEDTLILHNNVSAISLNTNAIPCITNPPKVCFQIGLFTKTIELPSTKDGFIVSWVRCCRPDFLGNLSVPTGIGGTFTARIPGTDVLGSGNNSSPQFLIKDTALVCANKGFVLDFGATDSDGDSLSYSFCSAYLGGTSSVPNPGTEPDGLPPVLNLFPLPYKEPYGGNAPLGQAVNINPQTGIITGKAPAAGRYVINVCVTEWRDGKPINEHRKDFIIEIANCNFAASDPIPATGTWCDDFAVPFSNNSTSSNIISYHWDFGVQNATNDTSIEPTPIYKYADTGVYKVLLTVKGSVGCVDTASTTISLYPGFTPQFEVVGSCFKTPFKFKDLSKTAYGVVNSWKWDFGDISTTSDFSFSQNTTYKYPTAGLRDVTMIVKSSKGCVDSVTLPVTVKDVALLTMPFRDTLICSSDTLPLLAIGSGTFSWSPANNIINANTSTPLVFPKDTTTYYVSVRDENDCLNSDSVKVNVLDFITVNAGADTVICRTDSITLYPISQGLQYEWEPLTGISGNSKLKNIVVRPDVSTDYFVTAHLGKCAATDAISVKVAPYPAAAAGDDVTICYGKTTQLSASIVASSFSWAPSNLLTNSNSLTPEAHPTVTTSFILTAYDTLGCSKASQDTVVVSVIPKINAFAGNDTFIVANQPLQLQATGASIYQWSPGIGMTDPNIADPVVTLGPSYDSIIYKVRASTIEGCYGDDEMKVVVFKTAPDIFIPTAFTPNVDGKNDVLKPIPVGVQSLTYFRIYNRWGQLIYSTSNIGSGWDGTINGQSQPAGTYVYAAQAIDYTGKKIFRKGTIVLIR